MSDIIAADQLRLFIERIERLEEEKKGFADDIKDVYAEAIRYQDDARDRSAAEDGKASPRRSRDDARNLFSRAGAQVMAALPLAVEAELTEALNSIGRHFRQPKITLVIRPDIGAEKDGHVILTNDYLPAVIALLARRVGEAA